MVAQEILRAENGVLISVGDIDIADAISKCLEKKEESNGIGYAALKIREKFSKDAICREWIDYIKAVLGR